MAQCEFRSDDGKCRKNSRSLMKKDCTGACLRMRKYDKACRLSNGWEEMRPLEQSEKAAKIVDTAIVWTGINVNRIRQFVGRKVSVRTIMDDCLSVEGVGLIEPGDAIMKRDRSLMKVDGELFAILTGRR